MGQIVEFKPPTGVPVEEAPVKRISMDDGHTRIAHGLLEELMQAKYKLSGREYAVLMVVIRKTYGYRKSEDWVALSQFVECTGLDKSNCQKVIKGLAERKVINRKVHGHDQKVSINTDVGEWLTERPAKQAETAKRQARKQIKSNPTTNKSNPTTNKSNPTTNKSNPTPTKDKDINNNNLKNIVPTHVETTMVDQPIAKNHIADQRTMVSQNNKQKTKTRKPVYRFTEADMAFALYMAQCIDAVNGTEEKRRNLKNWAEELRKMREIDGRNPEQIAAVFSWCNQDDFWQNNIQSPATLRKKFAMLNGKCLKAFGKHFGMNNYENNGTAGQQHCSQQEYIDDISWLDR